MRRSDPCDFLFWVSLKEKVYSSNPRTEEGLKQNIRREISYIPAENQKKTFVGKFHICRESSEGKSKPLPPVRGMSTYRGTVFSTPPVICEQT
jgi:hypothetical protein